jgi:hypothetical protein
VGAERPFSAIDNADREDPEGSEVVRSSLAVDSIRGFGVSDLLAFQPVRTFRRRDSCALISFGA